MRGAPLAACLTLLLAAGARPGAYDALGLEPAPLPGTARYALGPEVDPLRSRPDLRAPGGGRLDDFRGDAVDGLPFMLQSRWKDLGSDLDPSSNLMIASTFRGFFERAAKEKGAAILPGLLAKCQEALLEQARARLEVRRLRVRRLRALDEAERELEDDLRRLSARARRKGRVPRDDGRIRRARERGDLLEAARREVLGTLPEAELSRPRLAAYRDELARAVERKVIDLHGAAQQVVQTMR